MKHKNILLVVVFLSLSVFQQVQAGGNQPLVLKSSGVNVPLASMVLSPVVRIKIFPVDDQAGLVLQPSEEIAKFLLNEQVEHFNDLADDMRSYTLKRDAIRRGLMNSNDKNAWRRALVQLIGERTAHIP